MREDPRDNRYPGVPQRVRDAVEENRMKSGVCKDDFDPVASGGVALEDGSKVRTKCFEHDSWILLCLVALDERGCEGGNSVFAAERPNIFRRRRFDVHRFLGNVQDVCDVATYL